VLLAIVGVFISAMDKNGLFAMLEQEITQIEFFSIKYYSI